MDKDEELYLSPNALNCIQLLQEIQTMNTAEKIFEEVRAMPEVQAREVLDFVGYLKAKVGGRNAALPVDMSDFDRFGAVYDGRFNRDESHDRQGLR
jgi:hypothetical protein